MTGGGFGGAVVALLKTAAFPKYRKESQRDDKKIRPAALPAQHRPRLRAGGARRAVSVSQKQR